MFMELDLGGSLPAAITAKANKDSGYQIVRLRDAVKKYLKGQNLA